VNADYYPEVQGSSSQGPKFTADGKPIWPYVNLEDSKRAEEPQPPADIQILDDSLSSIEQDASALTRQADEEREAAEDAAAEAEAIRVSMALESIEHPKDWDKASFPDADKDKDDQKKQD
jgi:hypothetical protein